MSPAPSLWIVSPLLLACAAPALAQVKLKTYESKYYIIHTDLDPDTVRDATLRITAMAKEYDLRTRVFGGKITYKLPFYLFAHRLDYYAAGGPIGSIGVFRIDKLMAVVGESPVDFSWHVVQHEGFHQFVHMVIGGHIPIWINEGLAEYFGEAVFDGDGYATGLIPPERLKRLKKKITDGTLRPLSKMMQIDRHEWNRTMSTDDYDLAWSMVQFLAHGENGKYERTFNAFLRDVGRTGAYEKAWEQNFGRGTQVFEQMWRKYWLSLPDDPTEKKYAEATVKTLTAFLARAISQEQSFHSVDEFFKEAKAGTLLSHPGDWLPPSLLTSALVRAEKMGNWSLRAKGPPGRPPARKKAEALELICALENGITLVGRFRLRNDRVKSVSINTR